MRGPTRTRDNVTLLSPCGTYQCMLTQTEDADEKPSRQLQFPNPWEECYPRCCNSSKGSRGYGHAGDLVLIPRRPYTELEPVTQCEQITNSLTLSSACSCSFASRIHMMKMTRVNILKLGYIGRGGNEALSQTTPQGHPSAMVKMAKKIEGGPPTCHHHHMAIQEINRAHELMSQLHAVLLQLFPAQVGGDILKEILTLTSSALSGLQSIRCESSGGSDDDRRCASDKRKSLQRSDRPGDHKRR